MKFIVFGAYIATIKYPLNHIQVLYTKLSDLYNEIYSSWCLHFLIITAHRREFDARMSDQSESESLSTSETSTSSSESSESLPAGAAPPVGSCFGIPGNL